MGEGPYYTLYRPYHLASIEAPRSIGMAIINNEPGLQPKSWIAEVIGHAKKDLKKGCLLYTSPSPRDLSTSRMPSSA